MATQITTGFTDATSSDAIQSLFNTTLLLRASYVLIAPIPATTYSLGRRQGKTMIWRKYTVLADATTPLTPEGTTPSSTAMAKTDVSATLALYGAFIELSDFLSLTQPENIELEAVSMLGQQAGQTIDKLTMNEWATQATNNLFSGSATSTAAVNAIAVVGDYNKAYRDLEKNKGRKFTPAVMASQKIGTGPIQPAYWVLTTADAMFDIRAMTGFKLPVEYGTSAAVMGEVGALPVGLRFLSTPNGEVSLGGGATGGSGIQETTDNADVHSSFIVGEQALGTVGLEGDNGGIIRHPLGSAGTADALNQRQTVGWKKYWAAELLDSNFYVELQAAVSA